MYQNPTYLPQVSNREDLLMTVSIFDDDTLVPIDMSYVTLAAPADFTAAAWTVTDGNIITTSATSITIPYFPNSGELSALALTVGLGLAIAAGDPITIADTATGLNTMTGYVVSYAAATGALVVQVGWTFQGEIRRGPPTNTGSGYVPWYDWGTPDDMGPILQISLGNGITMTDTGFIQILIPETTFRTLREGTFIFGLTGFDGASTRQIFRGRLPVFHGWVTN